MANNPPILKRLRAAKAYTEFTGRPPTESFTVALDDDPQAGYRMGAVEGIAYEATRDGETEKYFHKFKKNARPDLVARDDGKQLYLTRGRYEITDRGIEDMPPLMIMNPSRRPALRKRAKGKTTMARTRRHNGRFAKAPRRSAQVAMFRANPIKRRRRRARSPLAALYKSNPVTRRRHRRPAAVRRAVTRYRRNPIEGRGKMRIMSLLLPAAGIGLGAIGSELAMGYMPFIPANFKTGVLRHVTKGVISLAGGWLICKVNRKAGEAFALGGLTIAFHDAAKEAIVSVMPNAKFGYYSPGSMMPMRQMGAYLPPNGGTVGRPPTMGQYMARGMAGRSSDGGGSPEFGV